MRLEGNRLGLGFSFNLFARYQDSRLTEIHMKREKFTLASNELNIRGKGQEIQEIFAKIGG